MLRRAAARAGDRDAERSGRLPRRRSRRAAYRRWAARCRTRGAVARVRAHPVGGPGRRERDMMRAFATPALAQRRRSMSAMTVGRRAAGVGRRHVDHDQLSPLARHPRTMPRSTMRRTGISGSGTSASARQPRRASAPSGAAARSGRSGLHRVTSGVQDRRAAGTASRPAGGPRCSV